MTATTADPTTSESRTPRQVWQRVRGLLLAALVLVVAGVAFAAVRSGGQHGRLDPRSGDPYGSLAAAELLRDRGVSVDVVTTLDEAAGATGPDTTLLVTGPNMLTAHQQQRLHAATAGSTGRTVLIAPEGSSVARLVPGVRQEARGPVTARPPRCELPAARTAGTTDMGGVLYSTDAHEAIGCYPDDELASLLVLPGRGNGDTVLLGSPDILHNDRLDQQGNASLGLQLLGSRTHLVWYLPSLDDPSAAENGSGSRNTGDDRGAGGESEFIGLIPSGWLWGTLQLALAAVLAALWRARRFGPLVTERLPVAIRASESTEGRARLYRKADARDRASATLRSATRTRISPLLGVSPRDADSPAVLLPALTARLGNTGSELSSLLFGPAPTDDAALVLLTDQLDALEREVRTS
ncbi:MULTISPECIES: DUF4350 domain-containing protein [Streptomyces]|uniref:DUF4350 domain-containing protein n=1 Tax=Streptomyces mutomycini TaxID=284036 RepID=A0ABW0AYX6_9ACTN|nr:MULTISPECIES: DUF4350 domain-containing protein [Streptomyces]KPC82548.1 hypothetical protein ADK82_10925 [Streptomyces sp. NRRL S-4]